ncbi:MAG TPA: Holliday junction branch migration protein RuvA [Anaerolineales bacterium]|nr:Holliday junction branch migration protein RuvA [Anaerolineales bacterium]
MISSLSGRIQDILLDSLIVEVGGVGLQVYIPAPLKDRLSTGDNTLLYTHLVVREDALTLYGFESKDARSIYRLLLGVNGVGPRLALAVLSTLSPDEIRGAVLQERLDVFNHVPGIGKKTAQKIIIQLQDKIPTEAGLAPISMLAEGDVEVVAALSALGYSVIEAQSAIQSIPKDAPEDVETRLRLALGYFY